MSGPNDPGDFSVHHTTGVTRLYNKWNKRVLGQHGLNAEQAYRERAFSDIGNQQMQANLQGQQALTSSFGMNNPSGLMASIVAQNALAAPYGQANLGAIEAGRQAMNQQAQTHFANKQARANIWATLWGPALQWESFEVQREQIAAMKAQAAAAASAGG